MQPPTRSAVITGASSGIGKAIATAFARRGYATFLIARRPQLLADLAAELSAHAPCIPLPLDLADTDSIPGALAPIIERHPPINVLVNAAGFGLYRPFPEQSADDFSRLMRVNFFAPVELTRLLLPGMLAHADDGRLAHILNICSVSARFGPWGHAGYSASKGALRSFSESVAAETRRRGVRLTIVYPGIINTPYFRTPGMAPLWPKVARRALTAERVADAVLNTLGKPRLTLYIPNHYRALDFITAATPRLALHLVRRGSIPLK